MRISAWITSQCLNSNSFRYYGSSHPTVDTSVENLQYLSSRQALEDIVTFKKLIVTTYNLKNSSWVSFGGSYPGALSAWLRIKYPQTVVGAVASSGPVQAKVDFYQYLEVVSASLATAETGEYVTSIFCDVYIHTYLVSTNTFTVYAIVRIPFCMDHFQLFLW